MNAILSSLLENTVLFTLLFGGIWLVKRIFRKQLSAAMHYLLWGIVILKLLVPVGLPSDISPANLFQQAGQAAIVQNLQEPEPPAQYTAGSVANAASKTSDIPDTQTAIQQIPDAGNTPGKPVTPSQIDWMLIIPAIWACGAAGMLGWLGAGVWRMHRKLRKGGAAAAWMMHLFKTCKQELGIRKDVQLKTADCLPVPAITGIFKPVLMLPMALADERDEAKMRHIFLHELAHCKRGDIIVTLLLNLLNAIYWWNPLVWLTVWLINKDMETACDATVLKYLGKGRRQAYIGTIVEFAGKGGYRRLQPTLCMNDGRIKMKKRIKGMFLRTKTKIPVKIGVLLLACLMALACFTTACQPTPDKPAVVGKGDGQLEDTIGKSAAPAQKYKALQHWKDTAEMTDLTVNIDADVFVPDADKYPAAVIAEDGITQERADKILALFLKGATLYERGPDSDIPYTKGEIMNEILRMRAELADPNSEANQWKKESPENGDAKINFLKESIAALEKAYKTAPEKYEPKPASTRFEKNIPPELLAPVHIPEDASPEERKRLEEENKPEALRKRAEEMAQYEISGEAKLDNGKRAILEICKTKASFNTGYGGKRDNPDKLNLPVTECRMTQDQATELAVQTVRELGLDHLGIAAVSKSYSIDTDMSLSPKEKRGCYIFYLTRELNGVTGNYAHANGPREEQYVPLGADECVTICINDDGIKSFEWNQPSKLLSISNESVVLKPFAEIQEIFKKQVLVKGAWNSYSGWDKAVIGRKINIEQARLGLMRIVRKDRPGEYLLLPVWDFFGYEANKYSKTQPGGFILDANNEHVVHEFGRSYLTINAIDGSIIDRGLGY